MNEEIKPTESFTTPVTPATPAIQLSDNAKTYILTAAKWGKFLSIVGFVFTGLLLIIAFIALFAAGSIASSEYGTAMPFSVVGYIVFLMCMLALYIAPLIFLYKFAGEAKKSVFNNDSFSMETAFKNLKNLFFYFAVLTIIILALYAVMFVVWGIAASIM